MTVQQDIINLQQQIDLITSELGQNPSTVYSSVRSRLDVLEKRKTNPLVPSPNSTNPFLIGNSAVTISTGTGIPTEVRVGGSLYLRQDGYNNLYFRDINSQWNQLTTNSNQNITLINSNTTLLDGYQFIAVDSSSGPLTITLPLSPSPGKTFILKDLGFGATNLWNLNGNGNNIDSGTSMIINQNYINIILTYIGTPYNKWLIG